MIVAEVIDRLKDHAEPAFGLVEGSAELASLGSGEPPAMPAAYVFVSEEAAGENLYANAVRQRLEIDIAVVVVAGNVSDGQGAAASLDVEALKVAVRTILVGWQPPSADDVITNVGGKLVRAKNGLVWWELTFATAQYLEG